MPKLLFFDIDGTLFDDKGNLPSSVKPALLKARENGCLIFINSGRTLCNIDPRLKDLPIDGWSIGCGTMVLFKGETLVHKQFDQRTSRIFPEICRNLNIPTVFECDDSIYFDPFFDDDKDIMKFREFARKFNISSDVNDERFRAVKMFCFSREEGKLQMLLDALKDNGTPFTAIDRGFGFEMVPEGYTKATGTDVLRIHAGASVSDCYAFGDSRNDLPMLEFVQNSVAMGNAPDDVKSICRYVTLTAEEDGIKLILERLGLI